MSVQKRRSLERDVADLWARERARGRPRDRGFSSWDAGEGADEVRDGSGNPVAKIGEHVLEQARRHDAGTAQGDGTLDDQRDRDDRRQNQGPDRPANGLNDREHAPTSSGKAETLAPHRSAGKPDSRHREH